MSRCRFGGKKIHAKPTSTHSYCSFQIWRELAPHYFPADCFGGGSDLAGTGSTLFSGGLFWRQFRFGRNWLHKIFWWIVLEAAQIWRELALHYFPVDCFGGGSDLAQTIFHFFPADCSKSEIIV